MSSPGSTWHSLLLLLICSALPGCFLVHELETPREPPPAIPPPIGPLPPEPDAGPIEVDAGLPDAGLLDAGPLDPGDPCAPYFDALREAPLEPLGCDGRTFPASCSLPVNPCCTVELYCESEAGDGGRVVHVVSCDDWCEQGCRTYSREGCALAGCEWFDPGACGPGPEGSIEGPACIEPRGAACETDVDCSMGGRCQSYWVNPCAGSACDACGGEERRCTF